MAQHRGELGHPRLVVIDAEDELDDGRQRRARLHCDAVILEQRAIGALVGIGRKAEVVRPAERAVECGAAARVGGAHRRGGLARQHQRVGERARGRDRRLVVLAAARAVRPDRRARVARRLAKCGVEFGAERRLHGGVGDLLPVDDAVDVVDPLAPRRGERHEDAAVHGSAAARADELRLEADRRAVGDDLEVMVGEPRQERATRHLGHLGDAAGQAALLAQRPPEERDAGIGHVAREIEEHAVLAEIGDVGGLQILDRGIGSPFEQRHPVVVGAHVHAPLVAAEVEQRLVPAGCRRVRQFVDLAWQAVAHVHRCSIPSRPRREPRQGRPCTVHGKRPVKPGLISVPLASPAGPW